MFTIETMVNLSYRLFFSSKFMIALRVWGLHVHFPELEVYNSGTYYHRKLWIFYHKNMVGLFLGQGLTT
jgi:hypothetical protein